MPWIAHNCWLGWADFTGAVKSAAAWLSPGLDPLMPEGALDIDRQRRRRSISAHNIDALKMG
jgi:hypothetical protein